MESSADHTTPHRGPRSADTTPAPTDTNTPVCSECGADLTRPRAIRIGQRCRRPAIATLGALVLLATLAASTAIGWGAATKFDWNTVKPDWLLARQLGSADATTAGRAAGELLERLDDGRLDPARAAPVAERILQLQTDVPVWTGAGGLVFERMWKADLLREEHVRRYIAQSSPVSIHLRDRVVRGQPLPARFDIERRDGDEGMIVVEARVLDIWLDGERLHGGHFGFRASLGAPHPNGGHLSEPWVERLHPTVLHQSSVGRPEKPVLEAPPGRHTVRLRLLVARKEAIHGWPMGVGGMSGSWMFQPLAPIPEGASLEEIAVLAALPAAMRAAQTPQPGQREPTFGEPIETLEIVEIEHELEVVEGAGAVITLQQGETAAVAAQYIMSGAALEPVLGAGPEAGPLRLRFTVENTFPLDLAYDIAMVLPGGDRRDIGWFARDLREASQRHPYHFTLGPLPGLGPGDTLRFIFTPSPAAAAHSAGIEEIAGEPFQFDLLYPEPPEVINGH